MRSHTACKCRRSAPPPSATHSRSIHPAGPHPPSPTAHQTELSWLLDDALAGIAQQPGGAWRPATWQQVERDLRARGPLADAAAREQCSVQLREPLEALGELLGGTVAGPSSRLRTFR